MSAAPAPLPFDAGRTLESTRRPAPAHVVQFYENVGFLADSAAAFLATGREEGAPLVIVARPEHLARIGDRLRALGIGIPDGDEAGRLVLVDAEETLAAFLVDGFPDPEIFAARVGGLIDRTTRAAPPGTTPRVYGEMVDILWERGNSAAAIRLEELWNDLGRRHPFALMCGYHMDRFAATSDREGFDAVCEAHARVTPAEGFSSGLDGESRLREVSRLQQRSRALETEIAYRKQLEEVQRQSLLDLRASIAAREELEKERERLVDDLQRTVRFSEMFLGILGHDLRNPLHAIVTSASLLGRRSADESLRKPIGRILSSADRMARMIDQLLDFTQIRLGTGIRLEYRELDLRTLFGSVREELETVHGHCRIETDFSGDTTIRGDADRLAQLFSNLVGNALQHRVSGSAVEVRVDGAGADELRMEFRNEGAIPAAMLSVIFEPFHGSVEMRTAVSNGLGLGLFISRQIVVAHGGDIEVLSADKTGTRVLVVLPRHFTRGSTDPGFLPVRAEGGA